MPEYKLDFPVSVGSPAPIKSLADAVREVADRTNLGTGNARVFNQILNETTQRTGSASAALRELASKQSPFKEFAKDLQTYIREQQQAQNEIQKWGRMMETAYQENARREQKRVNDAKHAADKIIAQHERVQTSLGRIGARLGGTAVGSAAGLPGLGRVSGTLLSSMGLSGGAMAAVGGGATALFAGVEFTKSLDNLAKWAQQQKNASAELGVTVSEMEQLSRVSERTGINLTGAARSVSELSKEMIEGGGRARQIQSALVDLGLKTSVAFEKPYQSLTDIEAALGKVKDPADRARLAEELLGEEGRKVAASLDDIRESSGKGVIAQKTIDELTHAREKMSDLGDKWDVLKSKFATPLNVVLDIVGKAADSVEGGTFWNKPSQGNIQLGANGRRLLGMSPLTPAPGSAPETWSDDIDQANQRKDADAAADRNKRWQTWAMTHGGTASDRYSSSIQQIESDEKTLHDKYQGGTLSDSEMQSQRAQLEARKVAAEAARKAFEESQGHGMRQGEWQTQFLNRGNPSELGRQLQEARDQATSRIREHPQERTADLKALSTRLVDILDESLKKAGEQNSKVENEQAETRLKIEGSITEEYQKRQKETSPALALALGAGQLITAPIPKTPEQLAAAQRQNLSLGQTINSGILARGRASGNLSPQQLSGMELTDQLAYITQSRNIDVNEFTSQAAGFRAQASNQADPSKALGYLVQAADADVKAEQRKTQANIEAVEAINKFQEAAEEASAKIREQFSSFASGLVSAAREGHAGSFAQNAMLGQFDKIVGNFASGVYKPGMLQFPGEGTAQNPTMLGKLFQGTMFGIDPKAHQNDALASVTDLNTKATSDNTMALAGLIEALGYDPSSLGLSSSSSIPLLTSLGSAGGTVGGFTSAAGMILKGAGVSVPGLTSSAASVAAGPPTLTTAINSSGPEQLGTLDTSIATSDTGNPVGNGSSTWTPGFSSAVRPLISSGGSGGPEQIGTLETSIATSDTGNPTGNGSSTWTPGPSSLTTNIGMGVAAAGAAEGAYSAIHDFSQGGTQADTAGIGKLAGVASASLGLAGVSGPAAPILAGVGLAAGLISSLMGDPRANRQASINHELFNNQYIAPQAINRTMDISGGYADMNFQGNVRATDLSSIPVLQQAYPDPRHGVIVPGTVLSPFGGGGSPTVVGNGNFGGLTTDSGSNGHTVNVTNNVSAIDGDSVASFFQNNAQALGDGIVHAINTGGSDMANRLRTL